MKRKIVNGGKRRRTAAAGWTLLVLLGFSVPGHADSAAARNRQGNELFDHGKYREAEKAYVEAQLESPGRPELIYNLGNALVRQEKYDEALKALRQAISKGNPALQEKGWFNLGNALFETSRYAEAAQAYTQSLRLQPSSRDAKHNLELALRKLQEQKQKKEQQGDGQPGDQDRTKSGPAEDSRESAAREQDSDPKSRQQNETGADRPPPPPKEQQSANARTAEAQKKDGSFSRERAIQILDALQNQEIEEQRKRLERQARKKATGKDW